jgi:hypothetical protein
VTFAGGREGGGLWDIVADWKGWFEKIEECCRTKGWILADVAGYDFYWFGGSFYGRLVGASYNLVSDSTQVALKGLMQFMH